MHGFLFKKSGFYSKIRMARDKWQRRWVVLSDARLFYLVRTLLFKMFWMPAASVPALGWRLFYLVRIMFLSSALVCLRELSFDGNACSLECPLGRLDFKMQRDKRGLWNLPSWTRHLVLASAVFDDAHSSMLNPTRFCPSPLPSPGSEKSFRGAACGGKQSTGA